MNNIEIFNCKSKEFSVIDVESILSKNVDDSYVLNQYTPMLLSQRVIV